MLNTPAGQWPRIAANAADVQAGDPWGLGSVIETQARLWNHLLDANRSFWELYAPWLSAPSFFKAALAPLEAEETVDEPESTVDGVPDPLETQARTWNHFLDANRNLWTAFNWPVPWMNGGVAVGVATDERPAPRSVEPRRQAPARAARKARPAARKAASKRSRPSAG